RRVHAVQVREGEPDPGAARLTTAIHGRAAAAPLRRRPAAAARRAAVVPAGRILSSTAARNRSHAGVVAPACERRLLKVPARGCRGGVAEDAVQGLIDGLTL